MLALSDTGVGQRRGGRSHGTGRNYGPSRTLLRGQLQKNEILMINGGSGGWDRL